MSTAQNLNPFEFHYKFLFKDGRVKEFVVALDPLTLQIQNAPKPPYPAWAELTFHQCPNCPLNPKEFPHCPPATQLAEFVEFAEKVDSFDDVEIEIGMKYRSYKKTVAIQYGLSSLMGLYMPTSGCPILDKLRPMVRTHLPFAKAEEVTYRMVTMYLLAQFFKMKDGIKPDWELKGLSEMIQELELVNRSFWKRISATSLERKDGGVNALTHLDTMAKLTTHHLEEPELEKLRNIFLAHLKK